MDTKKIRFQSLEEMEEEREIEFQKMSYEERWENLQNLVLMNLANYAEVGENRKEDQEGLVLKRKVQDSR